MDATSLTCCCGVSAKCSEMRFKKKQTCTRAKNLAAAASQVQYIHTDDLYEKNQPADDVSFHKLHDNSFSKEFNRQCSSMSSQRPIDKVYRYFINYIIVTNWNILAIFKSQSNPTLSIQCCSIVISHFEGEVVWIASVIFFIFQKIKIKARK